MTTLIVPTTPRTVANGLLAKQALITSLSATPSTAPHASQSAQLLLQTKREFVIGLIEHGAIAGAAAVLSTVSYTTSGAAAAVVAQYNTLKAQLAAWNAAGTNVQLATSKGRDLEALARQAVAELLASGQMSADAVLAAFSYTGPM